MDNEESKKSPDAAENLSHKGKSGAGDDKMHSPTPADRCMDILKIWCPIVFGGIIIVSCFLFFKNSAFDSFGLFGLILAGGLALLPFFLCAWNPSFLSGIVAGGFLAYRFMKPTSSKSNDEGSMTDKTEGTEKIIADLIRKNLPPPS